MSLQQGPRTACINCGVKKWKRVGFDGAWICIHGHQYLGNEELGDDEAMMLGTQTRTIKARKLKREKEADIKNSKFYPNLNPNPNQLSNRNISSLRALANNAPSPLTGLFRMVLEWRRTDDLVPLIPSL